VRSNIEGVLILLYKKLHGISQKKSCIACDARLLFFDKLKIQEIWN